MALKSISSTIYILIAYLSLLSVGLLDNTRGPFFQDLINEFGFSDRVGSLIYVIPAGTAFFASFYAKNLIERFSNLTVLKFGFLTLGLGFLGVSYANSPLVLFSYFALFGVGFGLTAVSENQAIEEAAVPRRKRQLFSGLHSLYALAALGAPLMASFFYQHGLTWRAAFRSISLIPCAILIFSLFYKSQASHIQHSKAPVLKFKQKVYFFLISMVLASYVMGEVVISSRLVLFLQRTYKMDLSQAPSYLTIFFLLLFIGRFIFGVLPLKNMKNEKIMHGCLGLSIIFSIIGIVKFPIFLSLAGLSMSAFFPICLDFIAKRVKIYNATVLAWSMAIGNIFVLVMHFLVGSITEFYNIQIALFVCPFALGLSWILFIIERPLFEKYFKDEFKIIANK